MKVGLEYGFTDPAAAWTEPMTAAERAIWHNPYSCTPMLAFDLMGIFDDEPWELDSEKFETWNWKFKSDEGEALDEIS